MLSRQIIFMPAFTAVFKHRFSPLLILTAFLVGISLLLRLILFFSYFSNLDLGGVNLPAVFIVGFFFDLANAVYFCIPLILYLWLMPKKIFTAKWHRFVLPPVLFIFIFILAFNAVSEWFFWEEFNTRYNFIAVDYLIYTTEVIGNIRQSYPVEWIAVSLILLTAALIYFLRNKISASQSDDSRFRKRSKTALLLLAFPVICYFTVSHKYHRFSANSYINELAGNGMYELFAAYLHNELDYEQFYKTIETKKAFELVRAMLQTRESQYISNEPYSIARSVTAEGEEKKMNVVLISIESFSADFMAAFGNKEGITPCIDSLSKESLFFTNLYATGTRTVRGLEALSLCIPPTPGQSIVRRPKNENLTTAGFVFSQKGYQCKYIYGGYSYFDNMGYYFGNNSYEVVDRSRLSEEEIDYENIWGVADENLFTLALREIDKATPTNPVFAQIMTTSNHRPFTYPEGRIDIPSHTGREGAVKYTDYAIGKFIREAKSKPWFNNTLFVIVADHCASSAGKTELPIKKYHIPLLIYSPSCIKSGVASRMMSQIDIIPTVFGLLNFTYESHFYGCDIFKLEEGRERAFISTYQSLGYLRHDTLVVLNPQKQVMVYKADYQNETSVPIAPNQKLIDEAIAWYETASFQFKEGLLKAK